MLRRVLLAVLIAGVLPAQTYSPGPQVSTFFSSIDDSDQPYALYLPKNYSAEKAYPLVISLHGAFSNHRLNLRRVFGMGNLTGETDLEATRYFPILRPIDFVVASPLARGTMGYQGIPEKDVYAVFEDVKKRFHIDEDRVYLTGLSMGGGGALWLGLTRPDVWAAIAPVCPSVPRGLEELAPNALNLPVHLFHGAVDPTVPVEVSRRWYKTLLDLGTPSEYMEYPKVRHNSWDLAYKNGAIFDWFAKFKRNRYPDRVRFISERLEYNSAYWIRLDGFTAGTPASIQARFTAENQITLQTTNVDGFTLTLAGHPSFASGQPLTITLNGAALKIPKATPVVSFVRSGKAWSQGLYKPALDEKRPGMEGPIANAFVSRHVYVYGTRDQPVKEELEHRRDVATQASGWSSPALPLLLHFRALADKDLQPNDIANSNLVLFGTKETNAAIAKFADRLPMELNAGAADFGLVFVFPLDGHYVVVNSGLPWWTGGEYTNRMDLRYVAIKPRLLQSFGDFILFKGSLENVVLEGRFDRHWKLAPEAAAKLKQSGAVLVKQEITKQ
jgi:hypothetical protein